jgi:hypothetical protein
MGNEWKVGLDAFIAIWQRVPGFSWLARLAQIPGIYFAMNVGYHLFARVRPWLPRRKRECESGVCRRF